MATVNVSLDKLLKRLDNISASLKSINQTGLRQLSKTLGIDELNINQQQEEELSFDNSATQIGTNNYVANVVVEWSEAYNNAIFEKAESRVQEFISKIERVFDKANEFSFNISVDKLVGIEADVSNIAAAILETFLQAIKMVNWSKIGAYIEKLFKSVDWAGIANPISSGMEKTISQSKLTDWLSDISKTVTDELFSGKLFTRFKDLEKLMSGGLTDGKGLLSKLADSIALTVGGAGTLSEALAAVFGKSGGVASIVAGTLIGVTNFVEMLKTGFNWLKELLMVLGIALAGVGAVILGIPASIAALVAAIVAGVATIIIVVKDNWDAICTWFADFGEWFNENVIHPIVEYFKELWESVSGFFVALWDDISQIWGIVSEWFNENVITPVISFFEGFFSRVQQVFEGLWIIVQAIWIVVSEWFNENVIIPVVSAFQWVVETVSDFFKGLWEGIEKLWGSVSGWFYENVISPLIEYFAGIWIGVSSFFEGLWQDIKDVWNGVSEWFNTNVIEPLLVFFTSLWDGIKQGMVSAMNVVIGGIESGINFIINGINSIIGGFNRIVSWAAEIVEIEWAGVEQISLVELKRIENFETGGYPENASLFWANEYGVPELVGTVGNKSAVASGTEITGIADAVYSTGQAETTLLASAVNLLQEIANKDMSVKIGDRDIAKANYRGQNSLGLKLITSF